MRLLELLQVQCIGVLIVASTFCLFIDLLNHANKLADYTGGHFLLENILVSAIALCRKYIT